MKRIPLNGIFDLSNCDRVKCPPPSRKVRKGNTCYCSTPTGVERLTPNTAEGVTAYYGAPYGLRSAAAEIMEDPTTFLPDNATVDSNGQIIIDGRVVGQVEALRNEPETAGLTFETANIIGAGVGAWAGHRVGGMIGLVAGALAGYWAGGQFTK
jgi:hypothetical protein